MRALVIDDTPKSAHVLKKGLEAEFYAVDVSLSIQQAVCIAETGEYDVIVAKCPLEDVSIVEVVTKLRENKVSSAILCICEKDNLDQKVQLLAGGSDDVLIKPYNFEELIARLRAILRRVGPKNQNRVIVGVLELDVAAHEVKYDKEQIKLRSREFDLLAYLMKNAGRVVTRNMVLENVWDINADSFSNTVEVHITHLRRKLGRGGRMIKTIRGVGYKLIEDEE